MKKTVGLLRHRRFLWYTDYPAPEWKQVANGGWKRCLHSTKAFLREEGGPRSGGRSLRDHKDRAILALAHSPSVAPRQLPPGGSL